MSEKSIKQDAMKSISEIFDKLNPDDQKRVSDLAMGMLLMQKLQSEKEADKSA